jgi:hypothetical protein
VVVWWWFILTDNNTTPTKVVLSCFGLLVGLWQYLVPYIGYFVLTYIATHTRNINSKNIDKVSNQTIKALFISLF